jgi:hypothetical protein
MRLFKHRLIQSRRLKTTLTFTHDAASWCIGEKTWRLLPFSFLESLALCILSRGSLLGKKADVQQA